MVKAWIDKFGPTGNIRFDNAKEHVHGPMEELLEQYGVSPEPTCPYTPEQNGVAERRLTTIEGTGMAYSDQAELSYEEFWGYAWWAANMIRQTDR